MDASPAVDGHKRSALALLGLQALDREWLLARLPDVERERVVASLDELERLKLLATPDEIAALADAVNADADPPAASPPGDARQTVSRATARDVHRVLRDEPDAIIARLSGLQDWRWTVELAALLGPARAAKIARMRRDVELAPAVGKALIAALATRLAASGRDDGPGPFETALGAAHAPPMRQGFLWSKRFR